MKWTIQYSDEAITFIEKEKIFDEIREEIKKFIQRIRGEQINIDIKKLKGEWEGYYRIRKGKIRIILMIDKENKVVFIDKIDYRGEIYK
ncbi:MAG: type II toxin-antitoxin system RelE/ParE family toxin [Nitrososphaerota archaeon]|nr:type II toxin-antitoxin system RelE/ParE family toxin [Candidatus Aenigmarchaeota archaeon]MDW8034443.1 type II toxin-antitoxin system RelE/ParE family toxin [Nitrososphaerota archaeon]